MINKMFFLNMKMASVLILVFLLFVPKVSADVNIFGEYAVSIDANTGEILFGKNADVKAYPASVTKVLTALLLMEHLEEDDVITFSENAIHETRSRSPLFFDVGETMKRDDALMALMVVSANDVAVAIAETIAGSEEAFAKMMTERAYELGAYDSTFITASGLHYPTHRTTAYDMALIGMVAIQNEKVLEAMSMEDVEVSTSRQTRTIINRSQIFDDVDALAGKTGFTTPAGHTLMKIDEVDGKRVINVVFGSNPHYIYNDIKTVSDLAISKIENDVVIDETNTTETLIFLDQEITLLPEKTVQLTKRKDIDSPYQVSFKQTMQKTEEFKEELYEHGLKSGTKLGEITVKYNHHEIDVVDMVTVEDYAFEKEALLPLWLKVVAVLSSFLAFIVYVVYSRFMKLKAKKQQSNAVKVAR